MSRFRRASLPLAAALCLGVGLAAGDAAAGTRDLELRWQLSTEPDIAAYRAYVGRTAGQYERVFEIRSYTPLGNGVAAAALPDTDDSARLYIALTAIDAAGQESRWSNLVSMDAAPPPPPACDAASCRPADPCAEARCEASGCVQAPLPDGTLCDDGTPETQGDVCRAGKCAGELPPFPPPPGPSPRRAELRWQPSPDPDVVSYVIHLGPSSRNYDTHVPVESFALEDGIALAELSGFADGARFAALTALDAGGNESAYSNELALAATCNPADCADGDPCSIDGCGSTGCTHTPAPNGTTCSDGDPRTSGDVCSAGRCSGTPVCQPADCSDANACTADACSTTGCTHAPVADGTTCDDGNAATVGDACQAGSCRGEEPLPAGRRAKLRWQPSPDTDVVRYRIHLGSRSGVYETVVPVESFAFESGAAVAILSGLEDTAYYVALSALDAAGNTSVVSNELVIGAVCSAAACADANPCTLDACGPAGCGHSPVADGSVCSDGDAATLNDRCMAGTCTGERPPAPPACTTATCSDGDACTVDTCGAAGCVHTPAPDGSACNDGVDDTVGDVCRAGRCAGEQPLPSGRRAEVRWRPSPDTDVARYVIQLGPRAGEYDTRVPVESFALESGVAVAVLSGLDDSVHYVAMTAIDAAGNESVVSNELVIDAACNAAACVDTNPCTVDACSASGCAHSPAPDGSTCSDGQPGTVNDRCQAGLCVGAAPQPSAPARDDFDANGFSDLLALDPATRALTALLRASDGSLAAGAVDSALPEGDWAVAARDDFDGDGRADLLLREQTLGLLEVWRLEGRAVAEIVPLPSQPDLAWQLVHTGDLDGDARADLVWYHRNERLLATWRLDGAEVAESRFLGSSPSAEWVPVGSGDLEGDGMLDIVWRHTASGANAVWLMSGARVTSSLFLPSLPAGFALAATGDFDRDGRTDLVWRDAASGRNRLWRMDGGSVRAALELPPLGGSGLRVIGAGDHDGDGASDLVWHDPASGEVWLWTLDADGRVETRPVPLELPSGARLLAPQPDVLDLLGLR